MNQSTLLVILAAVGMSLFWMQACDSQTGKEQLYNLYEKTERFEEKTEKPDSTKMTVKSLDELRNEQEYWTKVLQKINSIDRTELKFEDKISYDLFKRDITHEVKNHEFKEYLIPVNHEGGFHTEIIGMPERMEFDSVHHYENYISRLQSVPEYFKNYTNRMRKGIKAGYTLPKDVLVEGYLTTIASQIVDEPVKSGFYEPFTDFPDRIPKSERRRLRKEGKSAIEAAVVPAYGNFLEFMKETYIPNARETIATSALPGGEAYYQHLVNYYTTESISAEEVHRIGLREVKRIRSEMQRVIESSGFEGNFKEFLTFLRTDPQFYVEEPEELLESGALIAKRMDGKLPELFETLPREPYGLKPVPDYLAPRYTGGRYSPSNGHDDAGDYWINTYAVKTRPLYVLQALTFHEAVPGHHLQIALADELDLPEIRRESGVTAFVEGWALYAERLGLEAGFYQDPYSNFGRLTYEMWRACRLVVDTGMHALGWSRQRAVDFMTENTALSHHEIDTEINRYIAVPGQALAYKMGELKIRELRQKAEEKLGGKFDVGEFHDAILLKGPLTLPLLEEQVDRYIQKETEAGEAG